MTNEGKNDMNGMRRLAGFSGCAILLWAGAPGLAVAQAYPTKVIRVVNAAQPGGNSDIVFRHTAAKMGEILGQQFVFDYRPGAGSNIGTELVAKSPPDGYTTLIASASFLINPALVKNTPFDPVADFTPLGLVVEIPVAVVTHPSLSVKNVQELIKLAKARPAQIFFSSSGPGTVGHLAGELLNAQAAIKLVHVPYKGIAPAIVDLLGGHVQVSFPSMPVVVEHVRRGKLRMIGQCGARRSPSMPDVPTMKESGLPNYVVTAGFGFVAPAGLPRPIVEKLNSALVKALNDPAVRKDLLDQGADVVGSTPEQHAAYIKAEVEKWRAVVKQAGIKQE
jgi:tripartite-type tricarboxylate transporter receptor subunit TctC